MRKHIPKYAAIAFLSAGFVALNNCGQDFERPAKEKNDTGTEQENPASDNMFRPQIIPEPVAGTPILIAPIENQCFNGRDDNGNGLVDCEDPDCQVIHAECSKWGPPLENGYNSTGNVVYPNGLTVVEDIVIENSRPAYDTDVTRDWFLAPGMFDTVFKDCWTVIVDQDPYQKTTVPASPSLVLGPFGPIGPGNPPIDPLQPWTYFGPRAGLINECRRSFDLMFHPVDDDEGEDDEDDDFDDDRRNDDRDDGGADDDEQTVPPPERRQLSGVGL